MLDPEVVARVRSRMTAASADARAGSPLADLTPREREILALIAEGLSNREIAGRLFLAEKTVKNYVSGILSKLGLQRRTQAAVLATEWMRKP